MLIKTISHKANQKKGFAQLLDYIDNGAQLKQDFALFHNIASGIEREAILSDFNDNYSFRKKTQNMLVHEIMSFSPLDGEIPDTVLLDICQKYIQMRAPNALVYARVHRDSHCHVHFMLSANELCSDKSIRMDKKDFMRVKREIEAYQVEKHKLVHSVVHNPELKQEQFIVKDKQQTKKMLMDIAHQAMEKAHHMDDFVEILQKEHGLAYYSIKGNKYQGVKYNGRKWRFKRLLKSNELDLLLSLQEIQEIRKAKELQQKLERKQGLSMGFER